MILEPAAEKALMEWTFFRHAMEEGASDLHIVTGHPPMAQIHGQVEKFGAEPLSADDVLNVFQLIADRTLRGDFFAGHTQDLDYTIELPGQRRRLRVNVFQQYTGLSMALRLLSNRLKTFEELGLPKTFEKLAFEKSGLVLVTGGTGSGKSTTLVSMLERINEKQKRHVITIEDPIEVVFESKKALIEQREIPTHVPDFSVALRSAMREAPHVILVGEIRDSDTAVMTLRAAQVGALVMATLHTRSAGETITRFLSMFADGWRTGARGQLADTLRGIMCQNLVPMKNGRGRVVAAEVLMGTTAAKHLIRDDRGHLLHSVMEIASTDGMITMEQSLYKLFQDGQIELQTAFDNCNDKQAFLAQVTPEQQKSLLIEWETELELKNLERVKEAKVRQAQVRQL
ncbi:MAG: PilT/PilU family type 4a pilus ATPase [Proteobacteria bacterium]|nr:PilT/PilU family type 4a pilus ATPase [Pseudomonadota bacterium]